LWKKGFMPRTRGVKYFYKIYCRIYFGRGASCPVLVELNVLIKFVIEYIVEAGFHAQD
jgi:hypothetical protein